jgi:hypothetical protein
MKVLEFIRNSLVSDACYVKQSPVGHHYSINFDPDCGLYYVESSSPLVCSDLEFDTGAEAQEYCNAVETVHALATELKDAGLRWGWSDGRPLSDNLLDDLENVYFFYTPTGECTELLVQWFEALVTCYKVDHEIDLDHYNGHPHTQNPLSPALFAWDDRKDEFIRQDSGWLRLLGLAE